MLTRICIALGAGLGALALAQPAHAFKPEQVARFLGNLYPFCMVTPRKLLVGHMQGIEQEVTVVSYAVSGCDSNKDSLSNLAVLVDFGAGKISPLHNTMQLGPVEDFALNDAVLTVSTREYALADPHCCPSRLTTYQFVVNGKDLVPPP